MFTSTLLPLACLTALYTTTLAASPEPISNFNVIWSETFSSSSLDLSKWDYWTGIPSNGEQEKYNPNNCQLTSSGTLLITPQNSNGQWTSCRIETQSSFQAKAGSIMIVQSRFKLGSPGANLQGIWPAFWSLGESVRHGTGWPECGEIDTFENVDGGILGYGTIHCGEKCNDPTGLSSGINFDYGNFHTWAHAIDLTESDWRQQSVTWYMDGQAYHIIHGGDLGDEGAWARIVGGGMFLTLNVAVGGAWPGNAVAGTVEGVQAGMEVQYVAVYERA